MKKRLFWISLTLAVFCGFSNPGEAATLISLINFPALTAATDTQSGNTIDYIYEHGLSELDVPGTTIDSGSLQLKHLGNQNLGPTAEIWFALSGSGTFIGRLGESNSKERTDQFDLPQTVLDEITAGDPWKLKITLSEQTSFNGEKLTLFQSQLQIDYTRTETQPPPFKTIPTTPEPSTFLILGLGLFTVTVWKYYCSADSPVSTEVGSK